jgi:glucose-6-phosphate 1-dehydrogenase
MERGSGATAPVHEKTIRVTIRTPAGHEAQFEVRLHERVDKVARDATRFFVDHGLVAEGQYNLALVRDNVAQPLEDSARLEDYAVTEGSVLALVNKQPQIDG